MYFRPLILVAATLLLAIAAKVQNASRQDVVSRVQIQHLHWSPNGKSILFSAIIVKSDWSDYNQVRWALYEVNTETNDIALISASSLYGSYSPDNTEIALSKLIYGNWEVVRLSRTTKHERRLTNHPARDMAPFWSLDGQQLVFMSERDSLMEVYTMDKDGNNVQHLTFSRDLRATTRSGRPTERRSSIILKREMEKTSSTLSRFPIIRMLQLRMTTSTIFFQAGHPAVM